MLQGAILGFALAHSVTASAAEVDTARLLAAPANNADWLSHGRTYDEQRFSPLARIDQANVAGLKLAWFYDFDTTRGQEATPLR